MLTGTRWAKDSSHEPKIGDNKCSLVYIATDNFSLFSYYAVYCIWENASKQVCVYYTMSNQKVHYKLFTAFRHLICRFRVREWCNYNYPGSKLLEVWFAFGWQTGCPKVHRVIDCRNNKKLKVSSLKIGGFPFQLDPHYTHLRCTGT